MSRYQWTASLPEFPRLSRLVATSTQHGPQIRTGLHLHLLPAIPSVTRTRTGRLTIRCGRVGQDHTASHVYQTTRSRLRTRQDSPSAQSMAQSRSRLCRLQRPSHRTPGVFLRLVSGRSLRRSRQVHSTLTPIRGRVREGSVRCSFSIHSSTFIMPPTCAHSTTSFIRIFFTLTLLAHTMHQYYLQRISRIDNSIFFSREAIVYTRTRHFYRSSLPNLGF